MADVFGAPGGIGLGLQDAAAMQLSDLVRPQAQQNLELGEVELRKARTELDQQSRLQEGLQKMFKQGMSTDPVKELHQLSTAYLEAGMPEKASEMLNTASSMEMKTAETKSMLAARQSEEASFIMDRIGNVKNAGDWQQLNHAFEVKYGHPNMLVGIPYNPETVKHLIQIAPTAKEQIDKQNADAKRELEAAHASYFAKDAELQLEKAKSLAATRDAQSREGAMPSKNTLALVKARVIGETGDKTGGNYEEIAQRVQDYARRMPFEQALSRAMNDFHDKLTVNKSKGGGDTPESLVTQIDSLIAQLEASPTVAGGLGSLRRGAETIAPLVRLVSGQEETQSPDEQNPATKFSAGINALKFKLPKVLAGSVRFKDQQKELNEIVGGLEPFETGSKTLTRLRSLKELLAGGQESKKNTTGDPRFDNATTITNQEDYDKLEDGTPYWDAEGGHYIKGER